MAITPLDRRPVDESRPVYRFVHVSDKSDPKLRDDFRSDAERGATPFTRRERKFPELLDGMSVYGSPQGAKAEWAICAKAAADKGEPVKVGDYAAKVELAPGQGFEIEDIGAVNDHLTIWGDADQLSAAVVDIDAAASLGA